MTAPGGQLIIEGRTITFSDLAESNSLTLADQPVLQFCKKWLDGQDYFEISTSGSTGSPKTIRLSRKQMEASALATQKALGLQAGMTALLCLDPRYIAGMMMLVRAMVTSMDLIVVPAVANPLEHIPNNTTIDFAAVVPYQLKEMVESPKKALLNSWRKVIVGGGAVDPDLEKSLTDLSCQFFATYGMTETISHVALRKLGELKDQLFHALEGVTFGQDNRGCLMIRANHLGIDAIVTNDLVELLNDKTFKWLGRVDFIINTGGVKVIPEQVEAKLTQHLPSILDNRKFLVVGIPDKKLGNRVSLLLDSAPLSSQQEESLLSYLKSVMDKFECPRSIIYSRGFVQTPTGKIDRRASLETALPPLHPDKGRA